jgi:hypothetical protein
MSGGRRSALVSYTIERRRRVRHQGSGQQELEPVAHRRREESAAADSNTMTVMALQWLDWAAGD